MCSMVRHYSQIFSDPYTVWQHCQSYCSLRLSVVEGILEINIFQTQNKMKTNKTE